MNPDIIAWSVITLALVALWHWIYESTLLPSLRQDVRYRLFALRDRLRTFKAEHSHQCSDETFHVFDDQLSWQMDNLPRITFPMMHQSIVLIEKDPDLKAFVEKRLALLNECQLTEYREIRTESTKLALRVMALNSGGWSPYILPIVVCSLMWDYLMNRAQRASVVPTEQIESMQLSPA